MAELFCPQFLIYQFLIVIKVVPFTVSNLHININSLLLFISVSMKSCPTDHTALKILPSAFPMQRTLIYLKPFKCPKCIVLWRPLPKRHMVSGIPSKLQTLNSYLYFYRKVHVSALHFFYALLCTKYSHKHLYACICNAYNIIYSHKNKIKIKIFFTY